MLISEIETVLEGGGRVLVRTPNGKTREYGLSRGRRMLEKPKPGMAVAHMDNGHLRFFASVEEAERVLAEESLR